MAETSNGGNVGFTQKEMWVRVDSKLDAVLAKQNHYDVELALLKARVDEQEKDTRSRLDSSEAWREEVRHEVAGVRTAQQDISSRQKATAYIVAAVVIAVNIVSPLVIRAIG